MKKPQMAKYYLDQTSKKIHYLKSLLRRIEELVQKRDSLMVLTKVARRAGDAGRLREIRYAKDALTRELGRLHAVATAHASNPNAIRQALAWNDIVRALHTECALLKQERETEICDRLPRLPLFKQGNAAFASFSAYM